LLGQSGELTQTADDVGAEALSCAHDILTGITLRTDRIYIE